MLTASTAAHQMVYIEECETPSEAVQIDIPREHSESYLHVDFHLNNSILRATQPCVGAEAAATKTMLMSTSTSFDTIHSCRCPACRNALILHWQISITFVVLLHVQKQ